MQPVRRCPSEGYYEGESCPVCGDSGEIVVTAGRRRQLSKYLSGALRHFPDDAGISVDDAGWTDFDALVREVRQRYAWCDRETVEAVVATDPKGRFERDGERIRAAYGHSVDVSLDATDSSVPDELFHGTDPDDLAAILEEGLKPMGRQYVHLSDSVAEARAVGERHAAEPAVLRVDAASLVADGWDVTERGTHVFTVERVPPEYLSVLEKRGR